MDEQHHRTLPSENTSSTPQSWPHFLESIHRMSMALKPPDALRLFSEYILRDGLSMLNDSIEELRVEIKEIDREWEALLIQTEAGDVVAIEQHKRMESKHWEDLAVTFDQNLRAHLTPHPHHHASFLTLLRLIRTDALSAPEALRHARHLLRASPPLLATFRDCLAASMARAWLPLTNIRIAELPLQEVHELVVACCELRDAVVGFRDLRRTQLEEWRGEVRARERRKDREGRGRDGGVRKKKKKVVGRGKEERNVVEGVDARVEKRRTLRKREVRSGKAEKR